MKALRLACLAAILGIARGLIPAAQTGYSIRGSRGSKVIVELFYDFLCDESKANWAITRPLMTSDTFTDEQFGIQLTIFPLPYHHHAFWMATAFRAYWDMSAKKTQRERLSCMSYIFANQEDFLTKAAELGETALKERLASFFEQRCETNLSPIFANTTILDGFNTEAREDWKYAASRTVHGTPSFIVNGAMSDDVADFNEEQWVQLVKSLLAGKDHLYAKQN